jgi:hypothetical protein
MSTKKTSIEEAAQEAKESALNKAAEIAESGVYEPSAKEKSLFHVQLEKVKFNPVTGERLSKAVIQKFNPKAYANFIKFAATLGFTKVEVLWNPEEDNF